MESVPACHALLLQPPPGDVTGPYPALCYLKSYAASQGYRVKVKDLGIEALHYLSHAKLVAKMIEAARKQCEALESLTVLNAGQQKHYSLLLSALSAKNHPQWYARSFGGFKRKETFFAYRQYKQARAGLNAFFELLSAVHYPTVLTAAEYPTATMFDTVDQILAHQDPGLNPYVRYYEAVLFPLITRSRPALVGISMVFANQSVQALALGRMIKSRFPDIHVTLGGAYLSQWVMTADDRQVQQLLTCADSIVCGEGEQAFSDLLGHVLKNKTPTGLANLIANDQGNGLKRFDLLRYTDVATQPPPDFSDLDLTSYLAPQTIIPYSISRGCYWGRCVFCQNRYGDHRMRAYQTVPVDKAVSEMTRLADTHGSHHFNFSNDVIDPAYLKRLSQGLLESRRSFIWHTDLRAEKAFDAKTCRLMASAGLKSAAIGFESGCQKTLDAMDKGKRVEIIAEVMKNLYTAGVATQAMGIFGMPGESESDGQKTVDFLEANADHISYYVMGLLMVLPGSRMHSDPGAYGVSAIRYDQNPLKTPEPIWRSDIRMSVQSVNRLYARLSRLEQTYAIDEYPYVGGLSTNHGFLYYTLGPDILKRLRREEHVSLAQFHRWLGIDGRSSVYKPLMKTIPRLLMPYGIRRSSFPVHQLAIQTNQEGGSPDMFPETERFFLCLPRRGSPIMVDSPEIDLLGRIDGRRLLSTVLKKNKDPHLKRALSFLWFLVCAEAIGFS